jgi:hypothetical protein
MDFKSLFPSMVIEERLDQGDSTDELCHGDAWINQLGRVQRRKFFGKLFMEQPDI